jgi:hypothetical protein
MCRLQYRVRVGLELGIPSDGGETMSHVDHTIRTRLIKANNKIKEIQRASQGALIGRRVRLLNDRRAQNSRKRWKTGDEFKIYDVLLEGRDIGLWLSRGDSELLAFELSVWLYEVEFLSKAKS